MTPVTIKNVWQDETYQPLVIKFWESLNVLPKNESSADRAKQIVMVAEYENEIVGVCTAHVIRINYLNDNSFYNFRTLIHPKFRIPGLVDKMAAQTIDFLENLYFTGKSTCIGVITLIEDKRIHKMKRKAVYPATGLTLIGYTKQGAQIRIRYFKGAKI